MLRKFIIAVAALALVAGCSSKKKDEAVVDAVEVGDKGLSWDPMGSDSGNIPGLQTINFEFDKYTLTAAAREKLNSNAEWIKANGNLSLQIEGHCDSLGSIEYNLTLGERRANAVKSYLVSLGIDGGRLSVISYGEEKPLATGDDESAHAQNRRANFVPIQ